MPSKPTDNHSEINVCSVNVFKAFLSESFNEPNKAGLPCSFLCLANCHTLASILLRLDKAFNIVVFNANTFCISLK
jgi:hypothetical protein